MRNSLPGATSIQIATEFALMAEQPLLAHSGQRRLLRQPPNDCEQRRDQRPTETGLENPPDGAVGKREDFDVRGHDSPRVVSTTMPTKNRVLYSVFCRMRASARREQGTYGKAR